MKVYSELYLRKTSWRELAYYVIIQLNTTDVI